MTLVLFLDFVLLELSISKVLKGTLEKGSCFIKFVLEQEEAADVILTETAIPVVKVVSVGHEDLVVGLQEVT